MAPKQSTPCPYPYGLFRRQPSLLWLSLSFCHIRQFNFANPAFKLVIKVQLIYYRYGYTVYQNIYPCYQASQAPTPAAAVAAVSMWWRGRSSSSRMSPTCKKTMLVEQKKLQKSTCLALETETCLGSLPLSPFRCVEVVIVLRAHVPYL